MFKDSLFGYLIQFLNFFISAGVSMHKADELVINNMFILYINTKGLHNFYFPLYCKHKIESGHMSSCV